MSAIAIITARGGSKRIPRKNIREFAGKPMLAYAIEAAQKSGLFAEVMVSTEDEEIASVARKFGASVPFMRSSRTADDHATTFDVLEEVLACYADRDVQFDTVCCIYPCVPFLRADTLVSAFSVMKEDVNAVIPVCKFPVPVEWALQIQDGELFPLDPKSILMRSQDLVPKYFDVGMFYYVRTKSLLELKTMNPPGTKAYIINESQCQDIDTEEDWRVAELKYKVINPC